MAKVTKPIPEGIREFWRYDSESGKLICIQNIKRTKYSEGIVAASLTTTGNYLKLNFNKVSYLQHRVAWFLYYNEQPPEVIDHKDGNGLNNAINNLRAADDGCNMMDITVTAKSTTGIKGVMPVRGGKLFRAEVCVDGKRYQKHSKDVAFLEQWVQAKRKELHGEFYK
ncbi:HNH endonuclease motif protein [Escherichia phage vB_EcoP_PAS7]|uniref:HNH endonuclease motif protein n=1 Tax=Escherichia phage vB_EcoP_PAS7 TaxID=3053875 RepID=A0AA51VIG2_9CAUD|nr:HNH endonuclease motif protein [Escherichia phage vB_EcoP_PAS7]